MSSVELLIGAILVAITASLSAAEIALFSLSRFQLRNLKEQFRSAYRIIKRLLSDPGGLLVSILVVNEIVNVSLSTLITDVISRSAGNEFFPAHGVPPWAAHTLIGMFITLPIILLFCEITPKAIGARANSIVAPLSARWLEVLYDFFKPARAVARKILKISSEMTSKEGQNGGHASSKLLQEADFLMMVEEGHKEGAIQESELELIRNVFELDDLMVGEIATPLQQVQALPANANLKAALQVIRLYNYSRIPVLSVNKKEIVGILYAKDLLRAKLRPETLETTLVGSVMWKPFYVNGNLKVNALFRKLKRARMHMAVVQGEVAETIGIVTMSDVLDTIFEDVITEDESWSQG